jgi:ADP-heptose:LPS heptosyltransferase
VGINPGASAPNKRWFPERFAQVADTLLKAGITVMVLGAKSDMPQVEAMRQAMHHPPLVLAGQLSLDELILCLGQLDVLVSGDTGPAHLAAAMGTPVVGLFGPSKARHFAPIGEQHRIIDRSSLCAPTCSFWTCRGDNHACMRAIEVQEVADTVMQVLSHFALPSQDIPAQFERVLPTNEVPQPPHDDAAPVGRVPQ